MVKLSIIVPIYKVEAYLDQCVQSILDQTFTDFELILVDDGSPDACPQKCDAWAERDDRIKVLHKKNGGLRSAIVAGQEAAEGIYVGYVDGDDWVASNYFERLVSAMEQYNADMIAGGWTVHDGNSIVRSVVLPDVSSWTSEEIEEKILYPFWEGEGRMLIENSRWSKLWRADLLNQIMDTLDQSLSMGEDLEQLLRYLPICRSVITLPSSVGYYYRQRNESMTRYFSDKIIQQYIDLKNVLKAIALEQGRAYHSREKREIHLNFSCFDQLFTSSQSMRQYILYSKRILGDGPIAAPNVVSPAFKIGFWFLQRHYYRLGCAYLRVMYVINRLIYK